MDSDNIFTTQYMTNFQQEWNNDQTIPSTLSSISFNAIVGYGFPKDEFPKSLIVIKNGIVEEAKEFNIENDKDLILDWDIRCSLENWKYYFNKGLGMSGLASGYALGSIKFKKGNYLSMVKNPKMIGPFLKSFDLMGNVYKNNSNNN
ncbi:hypothetical protein ABK040_001223 [Willaertia magna]